MNLSHGNPKTSKQKWPNFLFVQLCPRRFAQRREASLSETTLKGQVGPQIGLWRSGKTGPSLSEGRFAQRITRWQPRSASNQRAKSRSYCKLGIIRCSFAPLSLSESGTFAQRDIPSLSECGISCINILYNSTNSKSNTHKNRSSHALERCLRHLLLIAPQSAPTYTKQTQKTHKYNNKP